MGYAQSNVCDPELTRLVNPKDPAHYQLRGTRCEGVYDPELSGDATLSLVSFTSTFVAFDPKSDKNLYVHWTGPEGAKVHLRGFSLKPRFYYQMDVFLNAGQLPFVWPLNVVRDIGLERPDLAVVAWTTYKVNEVEHDLYLPVAISKKNSTVISSEFPRITLWPGRPLNRLFVTVQSLDRNLAPATTLLKDEPMAADDIYPAEVPITLDWKRLKIAQPGLYSLKIGATVVNSAPATLRFYIYYAQR